MIRITIVAVVMAASVARADTECDFEGDYSHPDGYDNTCFIDPAAPQGCPIHVLAVHGVTPTVLVTRNDNPVTLATTTAIESRVSSVIYTKDVYSCDCTAEQIPLDLDAVAVTITGAELGDLVTIENIYVGGEDFTVTAPDACVIPTWPTIVRGLIACDPCPIDPEPSPSDGGCSAGTGAGVAVIILVLCCLGLACRTRSS
jgi:hypothetical protein